MASPSTVLLHLQTLTLSLILINHLVHAQTHKAPAPTPAPLNLTGILDKAGQFKMLLRLLDSTHVGDQIVNQLNNSDQGLTLFAPTDSAFNNLKPGTLNSLSVEQQVALVLYHVLPKYYSFDMFPTISNPVRTQATGNDGGLYDLNFTSTGDRQFNVSTGIVETQVNNALRMEFPLAIYEVNVVFLPLDLFGAKPPASAPPPLKVPSSSTPNSPASSSGKGPTASATENSTPNAGFTGRNVGWRFVAGIGLICMGILW